MKRLEKANLDTLGVTAMLILGGGTFFPTLFRLLGMILTRHVQTFQVSWALIAAIAITDLSNRPLSKIVFSSL